MAKEKSTGETHGQVTTISKGVTSNKLVPKVIINGSLTTDTSDPFLGVVQ